jgi:threonine/homoserine/homoserine lactone efflux protein
MIAAVLSFAAAAALIVLLPGPDTLVVVRGMLRGGPRRAALTAVGVLCGLLVWILAAAAGLAALLRASETGYTVLRIVGAVYLITIGIQSLRARGGQLSGLIEPADPTSGAAPAGRRRGVLGSGFVAGVTTDLLNPKVGAFFVTFLPSFVPRGEPVGATTALLGAIFLVETAIYFTVLIGATRRVTTWMADHRTRRRLERGTGVVLVAFGIRLAVEH